MSDTPHIIGRKEEQKTLQRLYESSRAEFLAVYGRRRVGKTYLVSEFFKRKGCVYFEIMGTKNGAKKEQLSNFHREFKALFKNTNYTEPAPADWPEAFDRLHHAIKTIPEKQKVILFFDELPWLSSANSGFLRALDYFWNKHASRMPQVLLIICGSAASWMIKKVVNDKGGLHGRLSALLRLQPFSLSEFEQFLQSQHVMLDRKQYVSIYMATGGVAKYLTYIPKGKSANQIIDELCFSPQGPLLREFEKLYYSLFDNAEKHIAIIKSLAAKRTGMTQSELLKSSGLNSGGGFSDILNELEESGFIMSMPHFKRKEIDRKYRLIDEYSLFYLKWIDEVKPALLHQGKQNHWMSQASTQAYKVWSGYAFENICLKHIAEIKTALGISGISSSVSHWQHSTTKGSSEAGAEIDLLIDRADQVIDLCEIKFYDRELTVDKDFAEKLRQKKAVFETVTRTRKVPQITLISPYGAKEGMHYHGIIDKQLSIDDLF